MADIEVENKLRVLIVAEHASAMFGGEAILPLHYYRLLRDRHIPAWMVVHERTKVELEKLFPNDEKCIHFIKDTFAQRLLWKIGQKLPDRISYFTVGFLQRLLSQMQQKKVAKKLVLSEKINVIHQPIPVSPKEPSLLFNMGAPVVIGPMNGGMEYPEGFRFNQRSNENLIISIGRYFSSALNYLMPGKLRASTLLVANTRTKAALPACVSKVHTEIIVENGVDLSLWSSINQVKSYSCNDEEPGFVKFVFMGRLVDWKAVDLLVEAFALAVNHSKISLMIIGDGNQRNYLQDKANNLGLLSENQNEGKITFSGWIPQLECVNALRQSDCLVLTSLLECGGAVVLEAMAMGLPVIATKWGGPIDYLDSTCGILIEPTNRHNFIMNVSAALCTMAGNSKLRENMGRAGRLRVEREFDWSVKVDRVVEIYKRAAGFI